MRAGALPKTAAGTNRTIAIGAGGLAVLLGALDTYVVITILRDIMTDVGIPLNQLQRVAPIITGYLVGYIAAMPLLGRASDRFGRKLLIQLGLAGFAIGSVVTALSTDVDILVIGRIIQGIASGALLPVTLALAADLWAERQRAAVLGGIGAAQELGSVLGPLYGIALVALTSHWQSVFWVNIPLALLAMVMIHFSVPGKQASEGPPDKVDVVGGLLLAVFLILVVIGLYNPEPNAREVVPTWRLWLLVGAAVVAVAFFLWERYARTKLIDPAGVRFLPFLASLGASFAAGGALMVTLVNVELFGQGVLGMDSNEAAFLLMRFLVALPIGALLGGWLATRIGDRFVTFIGLLVAAGAYWLISHWGVDVLTERHDFGLFTLPVFDTDLALAGIGLGLVIGPLTSAALRVVPSAQHGIASSLVVVSRMTGMLVGVAALSAWGFYRFNQILAALPKPPSGDLLAAAAAIETNYKLAFAMQYGEIFGITAIVCVVGALLGLLIAGKETHAKDFVADGDAPQPKPDDSTTQVLPIAQHDPPTVQIPRGDQRGRHSR
ncbi:MFS transporter [soil metagenome]